MFSQLADLAVREIERGGEFLGGDPDGASFEEVMNEAVNFSRSRWKRRRAEIELAFIRHQSEGSE
jgi:hypothetical protein